MATPASDNTMGLRRSKGLNVAQNGDMPLMTIRARAEAFVDNILHKSKGRVRRPAELAAQVLEYLDEYMCLLIERHLQLHTNHREKCLL